MHRETWLKVCLLCWKLLIKVLCVLCVHLSTPPAVKKDMFTFNTSKGFVGIKKLYFCVSKIIGLDTRNKAVLHTKVLNIKSPFTKERNI